MHHYLTELPNIIFSMGLMADLITIVNLEDKVVAE